MKRNVLATAAAACALVTSWASAAPTASNGEFTVTTDTMGLFSDVTIDGGQVSAWSPFAGASASVIPMQVGSGFALAFDAAPGYEIIGYQVSMEVTGGADVYTGTAYGNAPSAYASFGSDFGSATFDGNQQTFQFSATLPAGPVAGNMVFYAFPSAVCTVPLSECQDVPEDIAVQWAFAQLDYFHVTPIVTALQAAPPLTAPVDEPSSMALIGIAAAGAALRRRLVSARGTA